MHVIRRSLRLLLGILAVSILLTGSFLLGNSAFAASESKATKAKTSKIWQTQGITGCERDYNAEQNWIDITSYKVSKKKIKLEENLPVPDELKKWQDDVKKHRQLWNQFVKIIPPKYLSDIGYFVIFTDGLEWNEMDVLPTEDSKKWVLIIDIVDWYCLGSLREANITYTMIHEFGHMLTLGPSQVNVEYQLRAAFDEEDPDFEEVFLAKEKECSPRFMTHSGCAKENSYINAFVKKFGIKKFSEHINFNYQFYSNEWIEALEDYYGSQVASYVTEYAASDPHEDMAESFTAFVLKDKPEPITLANKKILFFYDYPDLIKARDFIRSKL